jgi:pyruvate/2-oxoglutarate dehydrogenase complex dihydrolipoamide acyltransferase (E2) component
VSSSSTDTATFVGLTDVVMPAMGTSIVEGTVIAWTKAIGEAVDEGEAICEISTDKIETECPSPATGILVEILVEVGETVPVGTLIGRLATGDAPRHSVAPEAVSSPAPAPGDPNQNFRRHVASPVARRLAREHGIELSEISGSGRAGRVTKRDVLARIDSGGGDASTPVLHSDSPYREPTDDVPQRRDVPPAAAEDFAASLGGVAEPLSRVRRSIADAMRRSQEVAATVHTVVEVDMSRVEARRRDLQVSSLAVVARATVEMLHRYGDLNAWLDDDRMVRFERVHLGIAVSLGRDGLVVPVIRDAQNFSERGLAAAIADLATRARSKKLLPDEARGATFTITSPGAAGAALATPVINLPEVAILDLEAITRRPVVVRDAESTESLGIRSMANLILGWDHRAVDGMYAAEFLTALRAHLEERA